MWFCVFVCFRVFVRPSDMGSLWVLLADIQLEELRGGGRLLRITEEDGLGSPCTPVLSGLPTQIKKDSESRSNFRSKGPWSVISEGEAGFISLFFYSPWWEPSVTPRGRQRQSPCPCGKWQLVPFGGKTSAWGPRAQTRPRAAGPAPQQGATAEPQF